jgi:hypothetical protein
MQSTQEKSRLPERIVETTQDESSPPVLLVETVAGKSVSKLRTEEFTYAGESHRGKNCQATQRGGSLPGWHS